MAGALGLALVATVLVGCRMTRGSGVRTGGDAPALHHGPVALAATAVPPGAVQVGIVQAATEWAELPDLALEFASQVAGVGGNFGLIDQVTVHFEMVTTSQTYTYNCGTSQQPRTCTGTHWVTNEVATTQMIGRAFHVPGPAMVPPAAATHGGER